MGADYRRRLPHWHPDDKVFFVTWRLYGSRAYCAGGPVLNHGESDEVALEILRAKHSAAVETLYAWVVMPNHVHLLLRPTAELRPVLRIIKGASARRVNSISGKRGRLWQEESFDRWVRDDWEFRRLVIYIEQNPVTARLVTEATEWKWSSVGWSS